ncbi:MAG TPA: methyltransferase domain-containing protein, partial [Polyangiaceae bacterium]|nr:methyltransferase domain-containing protein [Polyangiaceae bacterium]
YLEHELDPLGVLSESRRLLKKGGHVAIEIPDIEGWPARTFAHDWANLDLPRHLVFFEKKTLEQTFSKLGYRIVSHERFAIPLYIGISVLFRLGCRDLARHRTALVLLGHMLGIPFLPALPWSPEFSFVIAQAV